MQPHSPCEIVVFPVLRSDSTPVVRISGGHVILPCLRSVVAAGPSQYRGAQAPIQQSQGRKSHLHDGRDDQLDCRDNGVAQTARSAQCAGFAEDFNGRTRTLPTCFHQMRQPARFGRTVDMAQETDRLGIRSRSAMNAAEIGHRCSEPGKCFVVSHQCADAVAPDEPGGYFFPLEIERADLSQQGSLEALRQVARAPGDP